MVDPCDDDGVIIFVDRYTMRYEPRRATSQPSTSEWRSLPTRRGLSTSAPVMNSTTAAAANSGRRASARSAAAEVRSR